MTSREAANLDPTMCPEDVSPLDTVPHEKEKALSKQGPSWWAMQDLNLRLHPCER